jgi:hypothetical protein
MAGVLAQLWDWVVGVFGRIGDLSFYWLLLALLLKTTESALIGLGWRNILRAAYPQAELSFKTAWGASQGGTAINAVTPAQAGTAVMIGIFRKSIPGSSVAGVTSATVVQSLFFHRRQRANRDLRRDLPAANRFERLALGRIRRLHRVAPGARRRRGRRRRRRARLLLAPFEAEAPLDLAQGQAGRCDLSRLA